MTSQSVLRSNQVSVPVDFDLGRGYGSMGSGLPADFLKSEPQQVLVTIAALFATPMVEHANVLSQAVSYLALFASGARVILTKQQFRKLERRVRQYASIMRAEQFAGTQNEAFANYVLKHAVKRAKAESII
ncbi:MAG TPA: hypothetical protein V6C72_12875 [Chroococcales cyanobacterium]